MNEIEAEVSKIVKVLVSNAQPVEYGRHCLSLNRIVENG